MDHSELLPAPGEGEEAFCTRKQRCVKQTSLSPEMKEALREVQTLFCIDPYWVHVHYSNRGLLPWQGACTSCDLVEQSCSIQLRKEFSTRERFLLYHRKELLAHELFHAARMGFEEPLFEELLAYQTSPSALRRFLGPLFLAPWETLCLFCTLLPPFVFLFFSYLLFLLSYLPLLLFLSFLCLRLCFLQLSFWRCRRRLRRLFGLDLPLMAAFSDREILLFAWKSDAEALRYSKNQRSFRWKSLKARLPNE